jgi:hypothetical protein
MKSQTNPRIDAAVVELQQMILDRYPDATFTVGPGEDPPGIYISATVDVDDLDEVFDVVVERLLEMQVEQRLPVYVLTGHPIERVFAELHAQKQASERLPLPTS